MISRRAFIGAVAGGLAVAPAASAQHAKKLARIGYVTGGSIELEKSWIASLRQGLRELGYVEGETLAIELRQAAGRFERLPELMEGLIRSKVNPSHALQLKGLQAAGRAASVTVLPREVSTPDGIDRAFAALKRERAAGLIVLGDRMFGASRKRIIELTIANRLPTGFTHRWWVESGGLVSYGANFNDLYHRAATYVDKILRGARPGDIPVEQPTKLELVINVKTAKAIGLTVPPSLLGRADEVIQ